MRTAMVTLSALLLLACGSGEPAVDDTGNAGATFETASASSFDGTLYGEPLTLSEVTPISVIADNAADYVGRRVLVRGTVEAVCQMEGCWMDIASDRDHENIRIKVDDGVIVFPPSARGRTALVEGAVEEIRGTETTYRIRGLGALIENGPDAG